MGNRPIVGIIMGDPVGTGPETSTKALTDPVQYEFCRPIIIGDVDIMEQAKGLMSHPEVWTHRCETITDALSQPGTVDALHPLLIADISAFELAKVSAEDDSAVLQCVKKVVELAMAGEVDVACTNTPNKETMNLTLAQDKDTHSGGYTRFDNHMEICATYTGTKKYMMILAHRDFHVAHVSIHVPLHEACGHVKKARVLEIIEIVDQAREDMGIGNPHTAVAGLNPHYGESGLFGWEEIEEITPTIEATKAGGTTGVTGPCPPDSVFSQALGGWCDIVVCMYHDQGHISLEAVGFVYDREKKGWKIVEGVNVTLRLPAVRASVDHGIGFYHADKSNGNEESLTSAMKYTTRMAIGRKKGTAC